MDNLYRGKFLLLFMLFCAPAMVHASSSQVKGKVTSIGFKVLYLHIAKGNRLKRGDIIRVFGTKAKPKTKKTKRRRRRRRRKSATPGFVSQSGWGLWRVIAASKHFASAKYISGPSVVKVGSPFQGVGTRKVNKAQAAPVAPESQGSFQRLWRYITGDFGEKIKFKRSTSVMAGKATTEKLQYAIQLQYYGVFSRENPNTPNSDSFQTLNLQSQMNWENIRGSRFWHRHLIRLRYDINYPKERDYWNGRYRPIGDIYQFAVGYRFDSFNVGFGRLVQATSEAGVVDGVSIQTNPKPWLSLTAYGGLAPDDFSLFPDTNGIRYGVTADITPETGGVRAKVGVVGHLFESKIDRHFLFAEVDWYPLGILDLYARTVVDVVVPENGFSRGAPELNAATVGMRIKPLSWLSSELRFDRYVLALTGPWLSFIKREFVSQDITQNDLASRGDLHIPRTSARATVAMQDIDLGISGGASLDLLVEKQRQWVGSGWFAMANILKTGLRMNVRYSFMTGMFFQQAHIAYFTLAKQLTHTIDVSAGYRFASYLHNDGDTNTLEHAVNGKVDFILPMNIYFTLAAEAQAGATERGILVYGQVGWRK